MFSTRFFESDDKVWNIYRDEDVKETGLCQGDLVSEVFFDMSALTVLFVFSVTCWNWHSFCLLKLAKYLLINIKLAVCVLDKPVAQATLLGGTVVSSITSCWFGTDLYCLHHLLSPCWWRPPCFASIFQLMMNIFLILLF